jgi:hypothetical protein
MLLFYKSRMIFIWWRFLMVRIHNVMYWLSYHLVIRFTSTFVNCQCLSPQVVKSIPKHREVYLIQPYVIRRLVSELGQVSGEVYSIQPYVIKFVSELGQVSGELCSIQPYVIKFVSELYSIQPYVIKFVSGELYSI